MLLLCYYKGENGRPVVKCSNSLSCAVQNGWTDWHAVWDLDWGWPKEACICIRRGWTLAPPGKYHWTVHMWQQNSLLWNYFDCLY